MILEDQRGFHEDLERLEQAIADRVLEEPKNVGTTNAKLQRRSLPYFANYRYAIDSVAIIRLPVF